MARNIHQDRALPNDDEDDIPANEDEKDLEPTPLAVVDAAYDVDGGGEDDDLLDLGILMGKMRITERIGGFFRPKISQEVRIAMCLCCLVAISFLDFYVSSHSDKNWSQEKLRDMLSSVVHA